MKIDKLPIEQFVIFINHDELEALSECRSKVFSLFGHEAFDTLYSLLCALDEARKK